jgi:hypothetical protein
MLKAGLPYFVSDETAEARTTSEHCILVNQGICDIVYTSNARLLVNLFLHIYVEWSLVDKKGNHIRSAQLQTV